MAGRGRPRKNPYPEVTQDENPATSVAEDRGVGSVTRRLPWVEDPERGRDYTIQMARDIVLAVSAAKAGFNPDFAAGAFQVASAFARAAGLTLPDGFPPQVGR